MSAQGSNRKELEKWVKIINKRAPSINAKVERLDETHSFIPADDVYGKFIISYDPFHIIKR